VARPLRPGGEMTTSSSESSPKPGPRAGHTESNLCEWSENQDSREREPDDISGCESDSSVAGISESGCQAGVVT